MPLQRVSGRSRPRLQARARSAQLRRPWADHEDGARCMGDDLGGRRSQVQAGKSAVSAGANDDEIRILGGIDYCRRRRIAVDDLPGGGHPLAFGGFQGISLDRRCSCSGESSVTISPAAVSSSAGNQDSGGLLQTVTRRICPLRCRASSMAHFSAVCEFLEPSKPTTITNEPVLVIVFPIPSLAGSLDLSVSMTVKVSVKVRANAVGDPGFLVKPTNGPYDNAPGASSLVP